MAARKDFIHINSLVTVAVARYSASAEERETKACFFVFQDIGELPRVTRKPIKDVGREDKLPNPNHSRQRLRGRNHCTVKYLARGCLLNIEELSVQLLNDPPWDVV